MALTLIMTWPAAVRPFWIKLDENFDIAVFWWNLWWMKRSLWELHSSPFWCDYLMYPYGINAVFQAPSFIYGFLSIPVQAALGVERGIALSTNLVFLGSTVLTAWGTWLFAKHLTGDSRAAYVSGAAFAFAPFRFWHTGRFHLICTEFLVFYLFFFWLALEQNKKKHALAAGVFYAAIVYSSTIYSFYAAIMSAVIFFRFIFVDPKNWRKAAYQSITAAVFATLLAMPWLLAVYDLVKTNPSGVERDYAELVKFSGDFLSYFFPGRSQTLLGPILGSIGDGYPGINGSEIFLGYVLLTAAVIGAIKYFRRGAAFWIIGAAAFWIISFGPRFKLMGMPYCRMPYELLLKLGPLFGMDRDPCRYVLPALFCLSICAAFGVKHLAASGKKSAVYYIAVFLVLAEFFQAPMTMRKVAFPDIYYRMRRDAENYAVVELPMESPMPRRFARIYQTMHRKSIVQLIPKHHRPRYDFVEDNRFFQDLANPAEMIEHPDERIFEINRQFLIDSNIKYVIVHDKVTDPITYGLWDELLRAHRPVEIIDEPGLRAYRYY